MLSFLFSWAFMRKETRSKEVAGFLLVSILKYTSKTFQECLRSLRKLQASWWSSCSIIYVAWKTRLGFENFLPHFSMLNYFKASRNPTRKNFFKNFYQPSNQFISQTWKKSQRMKKNFLCHWKTSFFFLHQIDNLFFTGRQWKLG